LLVAEPVGLVKSVALRWNYLGYKQCHIPYLAGVGKLAGENDDVGVLPVNVCIILLPDSGVVCSLLMDF
jgi:hypothetical protein